MTDVSRETSTPYPAGATDSEVGRGEPAVDGAAPPAPAAAAAIFGARLADASAFARLLAGDGLTRGLIGPREVPRIWERHLLNCAVISELVPTDAVVVDVGSGAGLPGIPLALARPDLSIELLEPLQRRIDFLREAVAALALDRVQVVRGRADDSPGSARVDVVTARAVAPLSRLAAWCLPLLRSGGSLIALKGSRAGAELAAVEDDLRAWGAVDWEVVTCGVGLIEPPTTVVRVVVGDAVRANAERSGRGGKRRP